MQIVVETFWNPGEPSAKQVRVRPVPGQLDGEYRVWCSVAQREAYPVNSMFKVTVTWVTPNGKQPYLRISPDEDWQPVSSA